MLTEFGATDRPRGSSRIVDLADQHMVSWHVVALLRLRRPDDQRPRRRPGDREEPEEAAEAARTSIARSWLLERPYPQVTAGNARRRFDYDPDSGVFSFSYSTKAPDGKALPRRSKTTVYVPRSHYPDGYDAKAKGAAVVSKPGTPVPRAEAARRRLEVKLTVSPSGNNCGGFAA